MFIEVYNCTIYFNLIHVRDYKSKKSKVKCPILIILILKILILILLILILILILILYDMELSGHENMHFLSIDTCRYGYISMYSTHLTKSN